MASDKSAKRRNYSEVLQTRVVVECVAPGISVAKASLAHGMNTNVVHPWRQVAREVRPSAPTSSSDFAPVSLAPSPVLPGPAPCNDTRVQLRRGATLTTITWPLCAVADFAARTWDLLW